MRDSLDSWRLKQDLPLRKPSLLQLPKAEVVHADVGFCQTMHAMHTTARIREKPLRYHAIASGMSNNKKFEVAQQKNL